MKNVNRGLLILFILLLLSSCENRQKLLDILTTRSLGIAYLEENKLDEAEAKFKQLIIKEE
jgi:hypothetical protein